MAKGSPLIIKPATHCIGDRSCRHLRFPPRVRKAASSTVASYTCVSVFVGVCMCKCHVQAYPCICPQVYTLPGRIILGQKFSVLGLAFPTGPASGACIRLMSAFVCVCSGAVFVLVGTGRRSYACAHGNHTGTQSTTVFSGESPL